MIYDYRGSQQLDFMHNRNEDTWTWGWYVKKEMYGVGKYWLSHGSGNPVNDGDEFLIDKDTRLYLRGWYAFNDSETIVCVSPKREVKDFIKVKIKRV